MLSEGAVSLSRYAWFFLTSAYWGDGQSASKGYRERTVGDLNQTARTKRVRSMDECRIRPSRIKMHANGVGAAGGAGGKENREACVSIQAGDL